MVSTDICWDLRFSRSNPRQPAARESIQKPTGTALSPRTCEGSRVSVSRHLRSTQNRAGSGFKRAFGLCPNTRRQRCPSHPARRESGAAAKPSPGREARQRARRRGGSPSRGSGTPGGQRAARRAGRHGTASRRGTGRHGYTLAVLAPHAHRGKGETKEGQCGRQLSRLAAPGAQRPVGRGRSAAPNRAPNPRTAEGSRWRRRNFHRGRPRSAPGPVDPVQEEESPKQSTQTLPKQRSASYLPRSRRLLTARFASLLSSSGAPTAPRWR